MKITVVKNGQDYEMAEDEQHCPKCMTISKKVVTSCAECGNPLEPDAKFYDDDAFHQPHADAEYYDPEFHEPWVSRADAEFHHLGG